MIRTFLKSAGTILASAALAGLIGCSSQGLSQRESGMQTYSAIVNPPSSSASSNATPPPIGQSNGSMQPYSAGAYVAPEAVPVTGPVHVNLPARISVVQVGELAPPNTMLTTLRKQTSLFSHVSPQSGIFDDGSRNSNGNSNGSNDQLNRIRALAGNLGADYVLVFGGNIESGQQDTPLVIFNLTIVGAFIVPSTAVAVDGKAAGSLVDVHTGRVVMNFSSDTKGSGMASSAYAQNAETIAIAKAKDELVKNLTDDIINQMGSPSGAGVAAAK